MDFTELTPARLHELMEQTSKASVETHQQRADFNRVLADQTPAVQTCARMAMLAALVDPIGIPAASIVFGIRAGWDICKLVHGLTETADTPTPTAAELEKLVGGGTDEQG